MNNTWLALCLGIAGASCAAKQNASCKTRQTETAARAMDAPPIRIAVTVDDLPGSAPSIEGWPKQRIMSDIVRVLRAHHVPNPVGFANGIYAADDPDAEAALALWPGAGFELGNHSYSHDSANEDAQRFGDDVQKNQAFLEQRFPERHVRYFRYPFLELGATPDEARALYERLKKAQYQIADVSIDFADWAFSAAYGRCIASHDDSATALLAQSYLENAMASLYWSVETAEQVFDRPIPHILLLHAIVPTAQNLDALLRQYEAAGAQFITLDEALKDRAYSAQQSPGGNVIWQAIRAQARPLHANVPRSTPLLELACRAAP